MLTQNITLDFCRNDYKTITVKQRDKNSRNLLITCTDNGAIYKINNSTQECKYKMSTPDNRAIYKNATINTDGTVLITFDDNMLYELGTGKLEIQILEQATKRSLSTMILNVVIIGNVFHDDVITASDEFSALTDTLLSIEDSANKAKDTVELANKTIDRIEILETEVSSNEANRINTENERINAENIRIQNENKRQENTSKAIANAEKATESAIKATNDAISATEDSLIATELANTATTEANKATENTIQATSDLRELEEQVSSAETQRIANEEVRQSNEEKRQTDTSTAITNVEKATSDANTATENANIATQKVNKALEDLAKTIQSKADAIICEAEGTTIVATDSSNAGFEGLSLYGKSEQGSTTGAQLCKSYYTSEHTAKYLTTLHIDADLQPSTQYTISFVGTVGNTLYPNENIVKGSYGFTVKSGINSITFTTLDALPEGEYTTGKGWIFLKNGSDNSTLNVFNNIMLNAGSTPLPWEPYTGGKPSPNPEYQQEVVSVGDSGSVEGKVCGKNLLKNTATSKTENGVTFTVNDDGSVIANGTATGIAILSISSLKLPYGDYILSGCPDGGSWDTYSIQYDYKISETGEGLYRTINDSAKKNIRIVVYQGATLSNLVFKPMLRLASIEDDTYEPYKEQTLTLQTPNGLPGIKVSDASLATYTDETGQMWCADEIDVERGVYVKRVSVHTINYVDIARIFSTSDGLKWAHGANVTDSPLHYAMNGAHTSVMCDKFTLVAQQYEGDESTGTCVSAYGHANNLEFRFRLLQSEFPTKEDVVNAVNGTTVYYPLATPIETPLSDEEIAAYKALHTNKPTTTIMNSENVYMKARYVADTENHIKQNYIPLSEYTALEERVAAIEELVIS